FADGIPEGWESVCGNIDRSSESCVVESFSPGVQLSAVASCLTAPYNGASASLVQTLVLDAGQYELSHDSTLDNAHTFFCSGGSTASTRTVANMATIGNAACTAEQCGTCSL